MAKIKPKKSRIIEMTGTCVSSKRTDTEVRGIKMIIDEPEAVGGTNLAQTPVETTISALLGCTNVITNKIADANGIEISNMSVNAKAHFNQMGTGLMEEVDVPMMEIDLDINITTAASEEQIAILKRDLPRFCAVSKIFRQSGTEIREIWTINRP
jgi:putative redox protein